MERLNQVSLASVLQLTSEPSQKQLSASDGQTLMAMVGQMAQRYPSQDLEDSIEGYLWDFQQLALKYSLSKVMAAAAELRLKPGQIFFPRPDEVAGEIERQQDERNRAADTARQRQSRATDIAEFWQWAPEWMARTGNSEEELLRRFPSFRGTKGSNASVQSA